MEIAISLTSLLVSVSAFFMSLVFWKKQFRPIVTASIKTIQAGNDAIVYDLKITNSGSIPAKRIRLDIINFTKALGTEATEENINRWINSINNSTINILQNNDHISCSFGYSKKDGAGFWRYNSEVAVEIHYDGWFGNNYHEKQLLEIRDSESFTGHLWKK